MGNGYQGDSRTGKKVRTPAFTISSGWGGILRLSLLKDSGLDVLQYPLSLPLSPIGPMYRSGRNCHLRKPAFTTHLPTSFSLSLNWHHSESPSLNNARAFCCDQPHLEPFLQYKLFRVPGEMPH